VSVAILDERVLVLNRFYSAIRIIPARHAFTLLCRRAAEIISIDDGVWANYDLKTWTDVADLQREYDPHGYRWIRTPSLEIAVPTIVRLLTYDRVPDREIRLNRRNLFARDESRCQYCGKRFPLKDLSIDHVVPRVQGGTHSWTNLVCACISCNTRKGGRTPWEAGLKLITPPRKPKRNPTVKVSIGKRRYRDWSAFLNEAYWTVELQDE
jgi:5-methylcytosine-specific restriction endonuclease McrA